MLSVDWLLRCGALLAVLATPPAYARQDVYSNRFAVNIPGGPQEADRVAARHGYRNLGQIGSLEGFFLFEHQRIHRRSLSSSREFLDKLELEPSVEWVEQQVERKRVKRDFFTFYQSQPFTFKRPSPWWFNDPDYPDEWYLNGGAFDGTDMNVIPAWKRGITGRGVVVTVLDDGIQRNHPDLEQNYDPLASNDLNDRDPDPTPRNTVENRHGTRCAGEIAAVANNGWCGVGVAYNASIGGIRMLDGPVSDSVEADSLSHNPDHVDIYSVSWGPEDDGKTVDGPGPLARRAFINGATRGRRGLGSIFVWASGNGGRHQDSCNCDGYTSSIFTLSISSATQGGRRPWYLEECSSTLATTYSSGFPGREKGISTCDMDGQMRAPFLCTNEHTGTSASAPLAAGICALALQSNPQLTWRDMQHLVVLTSKAGPLSREDGWIVNGVGKRVSHKFGYGLMDAAEMVEMASGWKTVPPQHVCTSAPDRANRHIPAEANVPLRVTMLLDGCAGTSSEVRRLEHVQAKVTVHYQPRGFLRIRLTSPSGTPSVLLFERPKDIHEAKFDDWPFLSVHYWGEDPRGVWTLELVNAGDRTAADKGVLVSWELVLYGTAPSLQEGGGQEEEAAEESREKQRPPALWDANVTAANAGGFRPTSGNDSSPPPPRPGRPLPSRASCPEETFPGKDDGMCHPCHPTCLSCRGPLRDDCLSCPPNRFLRPSPTSPPCNPRCPRPRSGREDEGGAVPWGRCLPCAERPSCGDGCSRDPGPRNAKCPKCPPRGEGPFNRTAEVPGCDECPFPHGGRPGCPPCCGGRPSPPFREQVTPERRRLISRSASVSDGPLLGSRAACRLIPFSLFSLAAAVSCLPRALPGTLLTP